MQRRPTFKKSSPIQNNKHPTTSNISALAGTPIQATVVKRTCGTSPFDKHWLNMDCCGLFCAGFTYWLHLYGCYAVCYVLLPPWMSTMELDNNNNNNNNMNSISSSGDENRKLTFWGMFHSILFCTIAFLAILSHFKAMTTDPGSVPPDAEPVLDSLDSIENGTMSVINGGGAESIKEPLMEKNNTTNNDNNNNGGSGIRRRPTKLCRRCNAFKPDRAHHCSICKRCIIKMDHHCPWINNCVGIGNHKYFLLFIFYTFCSCSYSMTLIIARFINCIGHLEKHEPCLDKPTHLLSLIGLVVESMLFGMFTCCMMIDQWDVVLTKVTHIDRLKGEMQFGEIDSTGGINEVFGVGFGKGKKGSHFRPDWLSPFTNVCFPESMKDDIMGFCRPCFNSSKVKEEDYDDTIVGVGSGRRTVNSVADIA